MVDVLIVGAGPTGLTLAGDLARRGIDCRIIERAEQHGTASRAKTIQPRSLEVADDLGVVDRILARGTVHVPTCHYDRARVVSEAVEAAVGVAPGPDVPYPAPVWIAQPYVEAALRDRLAELGGRVELGTEVIDLGQDATGATVTVRTAAGVATIPAQYVVGCDGGRSTVRQLAGAALHGTSLPEHRWYLGDVRTERLERHAQHLWMTPEHGVLSLFPLPHTDIWQFQASIPASDPEPAEPSLALYQRLFDERAGLSGVRLSDPSWLSLYRINVAMVDRYRIGRVFLAGDAAHVHSPGGGQGMNTGIQDAYNLGWKLAAMLSGADATLLDTYQAERMPVARAVLDDSTARLHMLMRAAGDGDGQRAQRGLTDDFTTGLTIAYPDSPLTRPGSAGRVRAGDRAPDAPNWDADGRRIRLFDVFRGPHWTLLIFGAAPQRVGTPYGPVRVHMVTDRDGTARRVYGIPGDGTVLVRPDGYIAAVERRAPQWMDRADPMS
jgi:2-polyprenyl-6-methoxyphenol hydroxylase-like FAD-dependent oxidoreductase